MADHPQREAIERSARQAVRSAVAQTRPRREWTITKFGLHSEGYFHARVTLDGQPYYLHCRYGSWMAPGELNGRQVLREPESLGIPREAKFELADRVNKVRRKEKREAENGNTDAEGPDGLDADAGDEVPGAADD